MPGGQTGNAKRACARAWVAEFSHHSGSASHDNPTSWAQMITEYALLDESDAKKKSKFRSANEQELLLAKCNCKMSSWLAPNKKYQHLFLESSCS
jgi:hypothetical protein